MKLLTMSEWFDVCKIYRPEHILEKPAAVGYWRSPNSEHYWKLIPADWGLPEQKGHMMMETTKYEELGGR